MRNKTLYEQESSRDVVYTISGPVGMTTITFGRTKLVLFSDRHHSYDNLCGVDTKFVAHRDNIASFREAAIQSCRTKAQCLYITDFIHSMAEHWKDKLTLVVEDSPYVQNRRIDNEARGPMADVRKELLELRDHKISNVLQADVRYHPYFFYNGLPMRNYYNQLFTLYNNYQPDMNYPLSKDLFAKTMQFKNWATKLMNKTLLQHIAEFSVFRELVGDDEIQTIQNLGYRFYNEFEDDLPLNQVIIRYFSQELEIIKSVYRIPDIHGTTSASGVKRYIQNLEAFNLKFRASLYNFHLAYKLFVTQPEVIVTYQGVTHNQALLEVLQYLYERSKIPVFTTRNYLLPRGRGDDILLSRCVMLREEELRSFFN